MTDLEVGETEADGRARRGAATRARVMARATEIASAEGLEGLSIGRLATELGLSKSGIFALFGSKEELQLATVRAATRVYVDTVVAPAVQLPPGAGRLRELCERWLAYSRDRVFPGGCFFFGAGAEFDARPGPVRDLLAEGSRLWAELVARTVREAVEAGDLGRDTDAEQLAFEIVALLEMANARSVLLDDPTAYDRARAGLLARLQLSPGESSADTEPH